MNFTELVPKPAPQDVNRGLSPAKPSTLIALFGPSWQGLLGADCGEISPAYRPFVETKDCGPFQATGNRVFLMAVSIALQSAYAANPDLYHAVGTAGCLCARVVRGSTHGTPSNHSWGTAIDLTMNGVLDDRGDNKVQRGLLALYPYMHAQGLYWGTEFPAEDSMHFEAADETLKVWALAGKFGDNVYNKAKLAGF